MRRPAPISWMLTIVLCVLTIPVLMAAQVPTNRPLYPGEQWVRLFNGKDLTNWVEVGKEKWTVEDGTIHGQGVTKRLRLSQDREEVQGLLVLGTFQVRSRRQQRRLLSHRVRARHGQRQPGPAVRDRSDHQPPQRRLVRRRPTVDRLALARIRTGPAPDRLERHAREGRGQSHGRDPERYRGPELHGSDAEVIRWLYRPAAALGRRRQHALQGHLRPRHVGEIRRAGQREELVARLSSRMLA